MRDQDKIELYSATLRAQGTIRLSDANAEIFQRTNPPARFERDEERPTLVRVTRLLEAVR